MLIIGFDGLKLVGTHGIYPDEQIIKNTFEVDLKVAILEPLDPLTSIDYTTLIDITSFQFETHHDLLESLTKIIADQIQEKWSNVLGIDIIIRKLHPMSKHNLISVSVQLKRGYFDV